MPQTAEQGGGGGVVVDIAEGPARPGVTCNQACSPSYSILCTNTHPQSQDTGAGYVRIAVYTIVASDTLDVICGTFAPKGWAPLD